MTCRMATGKQKKRLIHSTDSDQCRLGKKAKFHSSDCIVSLSPHIGLKWDQHLRRVVPEKEQVGLLWSDLAPFIERPKHRSGLADVTYVPPATFSFENLRDILSYEVWATCLTEDERKFLTQFLPSDTDIEESVQLLLTGENLHFGNPFLSWSSSLCYGDIHPDAVLNKEKHRKAAEKAHRIDLHNYHSNMVETLKKWRKRWLGCSDTENLFSDNPAKKKQGVMQVAGSKGVMPLKVTQSVDVSKFMSYIEISRTQLNHIKRLKQSGDGIQTKHVSRVVGGLDKFPVKPFGALMEDEQIRLREHWLNMVRKDVPAAFDAIKDRKALVEKSRQLLGIDLVEKNVSVMRKADIRKDLGQHHASENDGRPILLIDQLEHSHQSMSQGRNDQSTSLQEDDGKTKYMETSICHIESSNVKDLDMTIGNLRDTTSQSKQISHVLNQYQKDVKCVGVSISCGANIPDEQNEDPTRMKLHKDGLDIQHEEIQEVYYEGTTLQNSPENQQIRSIDYTSTHIHTPDSRNMQVQGCDGIAGPPIHSRGGDHGLNSTSNVIVNHINHGLNVPAEKRHSQINTVILGQEEAESTSMMPSHRSYLLPKSSGEQILVEDFLHSKDHVEGLKDRWQMPGLPQSCYHPPENRTYKSSDVPQATQRFLSSRQQGSSVFMNNGILGQQLTQVTTSAFPMDNSAPFIEPFSNQQSNDHPQIVKDVRRISYSLQHANSIEHSTAMHSSTNNRLAESAPFPVQAQQQIDQSQPGLCVQLHNNLYSGVRFPNSGNPPVAEQNSYPAFALMDHSNWSVEGDQLHNNNLSGLESDNCLTQALPNGCRTDESLFSAISQYRQTSVHMQPGRSSSSQLLEPGNQVLPPHNFVPRPQDTSPPFSGIYGHTQNVASSTSTHVASVGSLNNMNWTNFIQQNPGMPDLTGRQFRGPWTR